ncbi:MAG TPA: carboxypeptidase regulatory-like domain-containing protein [Hymenobacter sp.]|jgi:hypothetical protein|uniref:carboxypeptidase regulatory-like domain-containing protein n=1 Tax=Hymenobacter sp. TaxID=1898978 RepID=UPI002EDBA241
MKTNNFLFAKIRIGLVALGCGLGAGHLSASSGEAGALAGTLREKCTNAPLTHVRVTLVRPTNYTVVASGRTDAAGAFRLRGIPAGTYQLRTDLLGYEALGERISIGRRRASQQLGTVAVAPVAEQQVVVRPDVNEPVAQVSRGVAVGRW